MTSTSRFEILSQIGAGGMGVVHKALDRERNRIVALKTLRSPSPSAILRFKDEFRMLQDIQHPNLVGLGELIQEAGHWFFTMELIEGTDLVRYLRTDEAPGTAQITAATGEWHASKDTPEEDWQGRFPEQGPVSGGFDEGRLRKVFGQLVLGLEALHRAGKVHRDIKPSNVLVTESGRVVVLDFGLIADLVERETSGPMQTLGTPDYMAPEQAFPGPVGPKADWYSVGVVLYQVLTGRLPFSGPGVEVIASKQRFEPAPPSSLVPSIPPDLDTLCHDLLRSRSTARPGGAEIRERLGLEALSMQSTSVQAEGEFAGRGAELEALREALLDAGGGKSTCVLVEGESGIGKTTLLKRFLDSLGPEVIVLTGRCYDREWVHYKAFDEIVDQMCRRLSAMDPVEARALLPRGAGLLTEVFPVAAPSRLFKRTSLVPGELIEPKELRARVFVIIREILRNLARSGPLVLAIEDLHWADGDSLALLEAIMRPPDSPPLLLLASLRGMEGEQSERLASMTLGNLRRLKLGPLSVADAQQMASKLARSEPEREALIRESAGNPFLMAELAQHLSTTSEPVPAAGLTLADVLGHRIDGLPLPARSLLEVIAVAGHPVRLSVAAMAVDVDPEREGVMALLRTRRLVRTLALDDREGIETYHDRIRNAVLDTLPAERKGELHLRLATQLERTGSADSDQLTMHFHGGGDHANTWIYALQAAKQASAVLAFDRAAQLYRLALSSPEVEGRDTRSPRAALAEALANAGRSAQSGDEYLAAASGSSGAGAMDLQRRAAEQYLRAGELDRGRVVIRSVLHEMGMRVPTTSLGALISLLWRSLQVRIRGLGFRERKAEEVPEEELRTIDTTFFLSACLGMSDHLLGIEFQKRNLLLALRTGEAYRIARALSLEVAYAGVRGPKASGRIEQIMQVLRPLLDRPNLPAHAQGLYLTCAAVTAWCGGQWLQTVERSAAAERILREQCTGVAWELRTAQLMGLWALHFLGEVGEFSSRVLRLIEESHDTGHLYLQTELRIGTANSVWLVKDDVGEALRQLSEARAQWSRNGLLVQHRQALYAATSIDLYSNEPLAAWKRLQSHGAILKVMLHAQVIRVMQLYQNAIVALGAANQLRNPGPALRATLRTARRIEREGVPWATPLGRMLRAGAAALEGRTEMAVGLLEQAEREFGESKMAFYATVASRRRGELMGGDAGSRLVVRSDSWMREQGVANPSAMARTALPDLSA